MHGAKQPAICWIEGGRVESPFGDLLKRVRLQRSSNTSPPSQPFPLSNRTPRPISQESPAQAQMQVLTERLAASDESNQRQVRAGDMRRSRVPSEPETRGLRC